MHDTGRAPGPASAGRTWPRRALLGLWVVVFVVAGLELASRWDALMTRLAGPVAAGAPGGPDR
ncbi:MAG: hypothetical protein U0599_24330 [Vicinamibacteria bacterium]